MEIKIEVPQFNPNSGIKYKWENGFEIVVENEQKRTIIVANKQGLISLANHLLNLAQDDIPSNYHMHFDELNSLEEGSTELIIRKK